MRLGTLGMAVLLVWRVVFQPTTALESRNETAAAQIGNRHRAVACIARLEAAALKKPSLLRWTRSSHSGCGQSRASSAPVVASGIFATCLGSSRLRSFMEHELQQLKDGPVHRFS